MTTVQNWTVTAANRGKVVPNPHPQGTGNLVNWYLALEGENGTSYPLDENGKAPVFTRKQEGNDLAVGDSIYGHVESGDYGPRFKGAQNPNAGTTGGGGGRGQRSAAAPASKKDDAFWAQKDRRISRAGILQSVVASGAIPFKDATGGEHWDYYVESVNKLTDKLLASLDERCPAPGDKPQTLEDVAVSKPAESKVEEWSDDDEVPF